MYALYTLLGPTFSETFRYNKVTKRGFVRNKVYSYQASHFLDFQITLSVDYIVAVYVGLPNPPGTPEVPQKYQNTVLVVWRPSDTIAPCTYCLERRTEGEQPFLSTRSYARCSKLLNGK